MKITWVTGFDL